MQVPPFSLTDQLADLGSELDDAVLRVLRSGQYIGGNEIKIFEDAFAASVNCRHAVGCNSGTDALVLALRGLGIGSGDEVITASFSFFATAEAISAVGATPVFVDVDPVTYLIDLNLIEAAITPATKVLLPVHLFGRPVNMARITDIAQRHGLKVVEDCAQATGASWDSKPVGSWGDVGCFSFFPTKNLGAAGDGGAMTCQDDDLAQRMRELAVHGMPRRYLHTALGYNSRLDSIQAAVLTSNCLTSTNGSRSVQRLPSATSTLFKTSPACSCPIPRLRQALAMVGTSLWCACVYAQTISPRAVEPARK